MKIDIKRNPKYIVIMAGAAVFTLLASGVGYQVTTAEELSEQQSTENDAKKNKEGTDETALTLEGTTQIQTESQMPDFAVNAVTMTVDEVYVEAGEAVAEGDALFSLTEESMTDAQAYYEEVVAEAEDALQTAELAFQSGVLEAEAELAQTHLSAENAQSSYDASVSDLNIQVEEKKSAYEDTMAQIWDYQNALTGGTYYQQAGIDEKQAAITMAEGALADAQTQLSTAQGTYSAAQTQITTDLENLNTQIAANASYDVLQTLAEQVKTDYIAVQAATTGLSQAQIAADTAQSTLEKANQSMESAQKEYNTNVQTANERMAELAEQLEEQKEAYEQAQRDATTAMTTLQKEYEEAVLEGKYAGTEYESALAELKDAVDRAEDTLASLKEEQTELLAIKDGVVCADRAGTLAAVDYEAEDVLQSGVAFASYCDTETIFISVEVPQENVAQIAVGDEVSVSVTGNRGGAMTGEISSVATSATTGGSVSNVTYKAVVAIDNVQGTIGSGSAATVTFDLCE